jgi:hypothetical protein
MNDARVVAWVMGWLARSFGTDVCAVGGERVERGSGRPYARWGQGRGGGGERKVGGFLCMGAAKYRGCLPLLPARCTSRGVCVCAPTTRYTTNKAVVPALVAADGSPVVYNATAVVDFPATNCTVVEAHQRVNCTTTEGAGFSIVWLLTIGNQTSQSPVTSYGVPTLTSVRVQALRIGGVLVPSLDPTGDLAQLSTEGGDVFVVNGTWPHRTSGGGTMRSEWCRGGGRSGVDLGGGGAWDV